LLFGEFGWALLVPGCGLGEAELFDEFSFGVPLFRGLAEGFG
jgi:hypothetical protein